ncbi:MAG: hypothetical protein NT010_14415 [Proteobacteria bacterium]|nr:hypothetical protein [Pseudomonadota bacterium]
MITKQKQKEVISVKQFVTDKKGQKVAAIVDIKELDRVKTMLEDLYDLKTIEDRIAEPSEDYENYSSLRL